VWRGRLFAVCGPGGTGSSTTAVALAQALAADPRSNGRVLLADFARRAEQAMLHDSMEAAPGVQELVEAHRTTRPSTDEIRALTFLVEARSYHLLLGLRQARAWSAIRPRAFDAALDNLRAAFQIVVADIDGDFEGEADGGSIDVEERNHMARSAASSADVVLVVGRPGMKGLHTLTRAIGDVLVLGAAPMRILPVITSAPRHPRARAELVSGLATLCGSLTGAEQLSGPVFLPERKVDELLRDGVSLPPALTQPLAGAIEALLERQLDLAPPMSEPVLVAPGSIGSWADDGELSVGGLDAE
jgi:hypothetical protein